MLSLACKKRVFTVKGNAVKGILIYTLCIGILTALGPRLALFLGKQSLGKGEKLKSV